MFDIVDGTPAVYVDALRDWGWRIRGRQYASCHMFVAYGTDIEILHQMAERIGLKRGWFQFDGGLPHYDLIPTKRAFAMRHGAKEALDQFMADQLRLYVADAIATSGNSIVKN